MIFLFVPVLKKDLASFEVSLSFIQCLSKEDIRDLLFLLKQVSWTAGIEALLKSKAAQYMYSGLTHQEQNIFIWDAYCLPYSE
jgi:DNA polymerase III psi subunit